LMEEILHQLICSLSRHDTPQVVIAGFLPSTVSPLCKIAFSGKNPTELKQKSHQTLNGTLPMDP